MARHAKTIWRDRCNALPLHTDGEHIAVVCNLVAELLAFAPTHQYVLIPVRKAGLEAPCFVVVRRRDGCFSQSFLFLPF
jgi:hypothetical protein